MWTRFIQTVSRSMRYATLRPYGDRLLSEAAAFWIFCVRLAMWLMATSEGVSWAYAAYFLATDWRWTSAVFAFVAIASVVWLMDASLMVSDRWSPPRKVPSPTGRWLMGGALPGTGAAVRIAVVAASIYITAPFMAQLMFKGDIDRALQQERAGLVAAKLDELLLPLNAREVQLVTMIDDARARLDDEVAGVGPSGRHGFGVAAEQVRQSIAAWQLEREEVHQRRATLEQQFRAPDIEALAAQYNLRLPGNTFQERGRILAELENVNFEKTELAVKAFLSFLFVSLMLLKWLQPRSVVVYYSEELQAAFVASTNLSASNTLSPLVCPLESREALEFEKWYLNRFRRSQETADARAASEQLALRLLALDDVQRAIDIEVGAVKAERKEILERHNAASMAVEELEQLSQTLDQARKHTEHRSAQIERTLKQGAGHHSTAVLASALESCAADAAQMTARYTDLATKKVRARLDLSEVTAQVDENHRKLATLKSSRAEAESERATVRAAFFAQLQFQRAYQQPSPKNGMPGEGDRGGQGRVM